MCEYQSELQEVSIIFCWPDGSGKLYLFSLLSPIKKGYRSNGGPLLPPLVPPVPASLNLSIGSKAKDSEIVRLAVINILIQQSVWSSHNAIIWHMAWSVVSGFFFDIFEFTELPYIEDWDAHFYQRVQKMRGKEIFSSHCPTVVHVVSSSTYIFLVLPPSRSRKARGDYVAAAAAARTAAAAGGGSRHTCSLAAHM